jgi:MFS family permease
MLNVIILGLASFLTDVSSEMVYPLVPLYLTTVLGASPAIVGIIEGFAESTAALLRVFAGYFSDRLGQRKPLTIAGYAASAVGKFVLYVSTTWPLVLISRMIDRIGKGIRTAPRDALIADSVDPKQRGAGFGLHRALDSLGAVVGVSIAYILFISIKENFTSVFLVSVIPAFLGVGVLFFAREKRGHPSTPPLRKSQISLRSRGTEGLGAQRGGGGQGGANASKQPDSDGPWWQNLGNRWKSLDTRLKYFLLIVFVFNLGNSSNQFLLLRANSLGFSTADSILLYLAYNVIYAVAAYPAGRLSDRFGRKALLVAGYLAYGLIYLGFAFDNGFFLLPLFGLYGIYIALTEGIEKALVSDLAPGNMRATLIGLHATAVGIGLLPASVLAGFLYDALGAPAPFFFGGVLGVAAAFGLWLLI